MAFIGELGRSNRSRSSADSGEVGHLWERDDGSFAELKNPVARPKEIRGARVGLPEEDGVWSVVGAVLIPRAGLGREASLARATFGRFPRARIHELRT